jgi:hypothetical protein
MGGPVDSIRRVLAIPVTLRLSSFVYCTVPVLSFSH